MSSNLPRAELDVSAMREHAGGTARNGKVLLLVSNLCAGGAQRVMLTLTGRMRQDGLAATLYYLYPFSPVYQEEAEKVGARCVVRSGSRLVYYLTVVPMTLLTLWKEKPQVVMSTLNLPSLLALIGVKTMLRGRCAVVLREANVFSHKKASVGRRQKVICWLLEKLYPAADAVVAISQGVARDLIENIGVPEERIRVVYNPILTPELSERIRFPCSHGWLVRKSGPVFVAVGRLTHQKGFDLLLQAFARVKEKVADARLIIAGTGEQLQRLESMATALGLRNDVDFVGYISNPLPLIREADAFVMPSRWEGLGNVLVEALACGTTPVVADCVGSPREVLEGGRYGYLVRPEDPESLAQGMLSALEKPLAPELLKARAADFSLDACYSKYLDVLGTLAGGDNPPALHCGHLSAKRQP